MNNRMDIELYNRVSELFSAGKEAEGLDMYGRAVLQSGDAVLLEPAEEWLKNENLVRQAGEAAVCTFIVRIMSAMDRCEEAMRDRLRKLSLKVVRNLTDCKPRQDTTDRYVTECILLRHMEMPEDALKAALEGVKLHHTASCATFAGLCYLDMKEEKAAEEYIQSGLKLDPENGSGCNDLADYFFNHRRYEKAGEFYRLVLETGDQYDSSWAEPSWLFCRYMIHGDTFDLERLAVFAATYTDNQRAEWLCESARRELLIPYVDYLPGSTEAAINFLREMRERNTDIREGRMALTCQEAASSINAIRLAITQFGKREGTFEVIVSHVPEPPLNSLASPDGMTFWKYKEDNDAVPALERPSEKTGEIVKGLAASPFSLGKWYEAAGELAKQIDGEECKEVYACMVYPPVPDGEVLAEDWLMRVQYAAACILTRISPRELERICMGQLDWPVIPALTLLAWQAREGILNIEQASSVLFELSERVSKTDYCFFEHAIICAFTWLPGQSEEFYQDMRQWRRRLEEF